MIAIIDYGMGNLNSVHKALVYAASRMKSRKGSVAEGDIIVTHSRRTIARADAIVLPGVGAFGAAMRNLTQQKLVDVIIQKIHEHTPFLGICLGLQILFEKGYEDGTHKGLGIIKGEVRKFELPKQYKIPHMGWNTVNAEGCLLFKHIPKNSYFYFVHSYYVVPDDSSVQTMTTRYGIPFTSGIFVNEKNLFGVQFHPEKSQSIGIAILKEFIPLAKGGCHGHGTP